MLDPSAVDRAVPVGSWAAWRDEYAPLVAGCMKPADRLVPILQAHVEGLVAQNVEYVELMVSGWLDPHGEEEPVIDLFRALKGALSEVDEGAIQVELLVAIGRGHVERVRRQAARILALARHGLIVGVALAGDEAACTIESIADIFPMLRDAGLGIEIHAGETCGPESVRDALEHGRPDRLGHAVRAFEDPRLVEELRRRDTHLEFCPASNLCLGVVEDIERHPIVRARELAMNFSVNTDDPGTFGCSMVSEFARLERALGFDSADFERIRANASRARFGARPRPL